MTAVETIGGLRREMAGILAQSGIEDPLREAGLILADTLAWPVTRLYTEAGRPVDSETARRSLRLAKRRADHEPLAYVTGQTFFSGLAFFVGPGSLVPRPDSEWLVETAYELVSGQIRQTHREQAIELSVLDTCTGSGCIGISLAVRLQNNGCPCQLTLIDHDPNALKWARRNVRRHGLAPKAVISQADLFDPAVPGPFDLIVANPPYIESAQIRQLMPEVSRYEPAGALDGGPDGLSFYRRLTREAFRYLKPDGWLIVEHGYNQAQAVSDILEKQGYAVLPTRFDYGGNPRVCAGRRLPI